MIEELLQQLVERIDNRYFGKYRGYVSGVVDPLNLGRIKARVPRLLGEAETGWALPCAPYAGPDQGIFMVPEVGAGVWIEFEGGDLSRPIWSGGFWGKPGAGDIDQADSTARKAPPTSEIPKENYPERVVDPNVRVIKSATGHYILLDDRPDTARIEIRDHVGNRIILSREGIQFLTNNEATVNEGNRAAEIDGDDSLRVGGHQKVEIHRGAERDVEGDVREHATGGLEEKFDALGYARTIDGKGFTETIGGNRTETVRGAAKRTVSGAASDFAVGGWGATAGGNVSLTAGKSLKLAAVMPDMPGPSLNAVSIDALLGNVSINSMLGMCQLGGLSAISPMVLGDGLAIHFAMLAQICKIINPLTAPAYGPLLDVWASMTPLIDWSYFGFVKRFPFG
jgi:type VI secretion system secreted protein VgrG